MNNLHCTFNSFSWISIVAQSISCSGNAHGNDFEVDMSYTLRCDESCSGKVWGCPSNNGWVTSDSKICVVSRMLSIPVGSPFTLVRGAGQTSYTSCTMNGITTSSHGSYSGSFRIEFSAGKDFNSMKTCFQYYIRNVNTHYL